MIGYDTTNATRPAAGTHRRPSRHADRLRRRAARMVGPALVLLMTVTAIAVPAQAATSTVAAGTTWSQLMRRKFTLDANVAALTALLPGLKATAATRNADLAQAQKTQTAAGKALSEATTADSDADAAYAAARVAAATARRALTAALQRRPRNNSQVARAKRALAAANATARTLAQEADRAASAVEVAQADYATSTDQATAAATAQQSAIAALNDAQLRVTTLPQSGAALAAQASAISGQVVDETRADFTMAQTAQVYGVTVNKIVAYTFKKMIDDAAAAGIVLSGGGFRTRQQQIALRTANGCPDIWTAPASSCRVPTAIPGRSLHELGLAIDLTSNKAIIGSRKSPAFTWLAANAGRYGFVNLPSEPWHWSITGG